MTHSTLDHQEACSRWLREAFPNDLKKRPKVRAVRCFEEVVELAQALDVCDDDLRVVLERVLSRPKGEPRQELGGAFNTLMMLADSLGEDAGAAGHIVLKHAYENIPAIRERAKLKPVVAD